MYYLLLVALGVSLSSYGFSSGASLPNSLGLILGWSGAVITVATSYLQYRASLPYEHHFSESDWQKNDDEFTIAIPLNRHKKAKGAAVNVLEKTAEGFVEVICANRVQSDGAILVFASTKFIGKIVVR